MEAYWGDYDEGPEPDYGVFGDAECEPTPVKTYSEREKRAIDAARKKLEADRRTSSEFNSYMIELFNVARK